jgi:hypothetical protein
VHVTSENPVHSVQYPVPSVLQVCRVTASLRVVIRRRRRRRLSFSVTTHFIVIRFVTDGGFSTSSL